MIPVKKSTGLLIAAIILNLITCLLLWANLYTPWLIPLWLLSLVLPLCAFEGKKTSWKPHLSKRSIVVLVLLILLPAAVRIIYFSESRFHGDDLMTAYFSLNHSFSKINFFSQIPQDPADWVVQFPIIYFLLQKIFFLIIGASLLTIKYSIIPYVIIVSLTIFTIGSILFDRKTAAIACFLYTFMAVSMYHETLGLHFVSSTAIFGIFFTFFLLWYTYPSSLKAIATGIACGACYLFYTSSYIAFPLLLSFFLLSLTDHKTKIVFQHAALAVLGVFITLAPFLTYGLTYNNYFIQRTAQVTLVDGEWSETGEKLAQGMTMPQIIWENTVLAGRSLIENGVGGHGGYTFGRLAMFEPLSLILLAIGVVAAFLYGKKKQITLFVPVVAFVSYIGGIILTIPPPAYHRASLAFPYLALLMALPLSLLLKTTKIPRILSVSICIIVLSWYAVANQLYFIRSTAEESNNTTLQLYKYIEKNYPDRTVKVASFPTYSIGKIFYMINPSSGIQVKVDYHENFLNSFNKNEKYLYVIIFPEDFSKLFQAKDPNGKITVFSNEYDLFAN